MKRPAAKQPLTDRLRALLDRARAEEVPLCTVDEAQLLAVGWISPSRGGAVPAFAGTASPHDFAGLELARRRLLDAGLARPGASDTPADLTTEGGLRDYLDLAINHRLQTAYWGSHPLVADPLQARYVQRRLTAVLEGPVVLAERYEVPPNSPVTEPLPIAISLLPIDAAADELAAVAYRAPDSEAERASAPAVESVFLGPDRRNPTFPSVLTHRWDDPTAILRWRYYSLFGHRDKGDWVGRAAATLPTLKPEGYRKHLLRRLAVPEPGASPGSGAGGDLAGRRPAE